MGLILCTLGWVWGMILADSLPDISLLVWGVSTLGALFCVLVTLKIRVWRLIFAIIAAFSFGGLRVQSTPRLGDLSVWNDTGGLTVYGQVMQPPDVREARALVTLQVQRVTIGGLERDVNGMVLIHAARDTSARRGDWVSATGLLVTPPTVDAFDYRDYLGRGGIESLLIRVSELRVVIPSNPSWTDSVYDFRQSLSEKIIGALPQPHAGLFIGMILGDDRWIAPKTMDAFNHSGAGHVLVVSGYNMTLIAGAVMVILKRIRQIGLSLKLFLTWGLIIGYAVLVGGEPSTVRAAWMAGLAAFGYMTGNPLYLPLSLAFSVFMQTAYDPQVLWDRGFQLSLAATGGMAFLVEPVKARWKDFFEPEEPPALAGQVLRGAFDLFLTTGCILVFTTPLLASYSGQFSWVTLPVNLLIVPAQAALLMIGSIAVILTLIFAPLGVAVAWLALPLIAWTEVIVRGATSIPNSSIPLYIPPWLVLFYWFVISGIVLLNDSNWLGWHALMKRPMSRLLLGASTVLALVTVILFGIAFAQPDEKLHIWFLDADGGNAVLIRTPSGGTIIVDGGNAPVLLSTLIGERLPANTEHIDTLILSAPDEVETGAWIEVAQRYPPRYVLTHGQPNLGIPWQNLLTTFKDVGAVTETVITGYNLQTSDGIIVEVLWPSQEPALGDALTVSPLVLRVTYGNLRVLLPSNLDREAQSLLTDTQPDIRADVLLLPNHAQARSLGETFLTRVNPSHIIIAAALERVPDADVIAMLGERTIYQTGKNGTLHLTSDGVAFSIQAERE